MAVEECLEELYTGTPRGYLTPAAIPSSPKGVFIKIGSASPCNCAWNVTDFMESPVATMRVLLWERATQSPAGTSFKIARRSYGVKAEHPSLPLQHPHHLLKIIDRIVMHHNPPTAIPIPNPHPHP